MNTNTIRIQSKRLMRLPFAPAADEDKAGLLQEYGRVFRDHCRSDAHVEFVVDHLMSTSQRCPAPAEIVQAAGFVQDRAAGDGLPAACDVCSKEGGYWVSCEERIDGRSGAYWVARRCTCARGRALAEADRRAEMDRRRERY